MSEVKRYKEGNWLMLEDVDGDWVKHSDHLAAMEALREAKDREIEGLRAAIEKALGGFNAPYDYAKNILKIAINGEPK